MNTYLKIAIKTAVILVLLILVFLAVRAIGGSTGQEGYLGNRGISGQTLNGNRFVILHYTEWCPACKNMKPVWFETKARMAGKPIVMQENDEDKQPTAGVNSYPTIYMLDEYGAKRQYRGPPDILSLTQFILAP